MITLLIFAHPKYFVSIPTTNISLRVSSKVQCGVMDNYIHLAQSCDKDCLENIRVYLTQSGQELVDRALNIKCTRAEVIWVFTDVGRYKYKKGYIRRNTNISFTRKKRGDIYT